MSTAGGGAAAVIVDIMANASQLGQTLQQAEQQRSSTRSRRRGRSQRRAALLLGRTRRHWLPAAKLARAPRGVGRMLLGALARRSHLQLLHLRVG